MGMSIEKIINTFDYIKHVGNGESEYKHCREEIALDEAVTIMRKYQKIEQIMKSKKMDALNVGLLIPKDMACVLHKIKEVLEDGNNNR